MKEKKLIYIASPYAGDVDSNIEFAKKACRHCIDQGHTPIAVHLLYPQILDDSDPAQRQIGLELGHNVLAACDEVWICGDTISQGMTTEIAEAANLGKPIRQISTQQMLNPPSPQYGVWAETTPSTRLSGREGFLCEDNRLMTFDRKEAAHFRMDDLCLMRLNGTPAANYVIKECTPGNMPASDFKVLDYEPIRALDTIPGFDPENFIVKSQVYGNTGGGFMVATTEVYLPELERAVWVNCNSEGVTITAADYMWQSDHPADLCVDHVYENVLLCFFDYPTQVPNEAKPWLPMCKDAIEYAIQQDNDHYNRPMSIPIAWLPDSIKQAADSEYLSWAAEQNIWVEVMNGKVEIDDSYLPPEPSQAQGYSGIQG